MSFGRLRGNKWLSWVLLGALATGLVTGMGGCGERLREIQQQIQGQPESNSSTAPPPALPAPEPGAPAPSQETQTVVLYFSDAQGKGLVKEERSIPKVEGIARATIEELIKGPAPGSALIPTIPQGTQLKDINVRKDGLCIVDFSEELVKNHKGGSTGEALTVYSIVNTLAQFPTVKQVKILVDGKEIQSLAGHLDVSEALAPDHSLVIGQ